MGLNIAIIAKKGKREVCEKRDIFDLRYEQQSGMEIIDADWIKQRLTGRHGERAELARAMGVSPDVVTKILKGDRRVQPAEMPLIYAHFSNQQDDNPDPTMQKLLQRIPQLTGPERDLLLAAAEGMIARRHGEGE